MNTSTVDPWGSDWVWSMPLIIVTVVFHAYALGFLYEWVSFLLEKKRKRIFGRILPMFVVGGSALCAIILHAIEAMAWALTYSQLGALTDRKSAILYSLSAMTTHGASVRLEPRWELMGALEALDGWILFGLTTALLFNVIQKVWSEKDPST